MKSIYTIKPGDSIYLLRDANLRELKIRRLEPNIPFDDENINTKFIHIYLVGAIAVKVRREEIEDEFCVNCTNAFGAEGKLYTDINYVMQKYETISNEIKEKLKRLKYQNRMFGFNLTLSNFRRTHACMVINRLFENS